MSNTNAPSGASITLEDVELISSYNCIAADSHTIVVPGIPAKWLDRADKSQLKPDRGARLLDYNAGQWRESPMDPGIRAVLHLHPKYDFTKLDIIADRRQLGCLLEVTFRKGEPYQKAWDGDERTSAFRFGAQVVGSTIVLVRADDGANMENIDSFRGFADEFKAKYLEYPDDLKDSKTHHRMISSRLGYVRLLLRHQADGYLPSDTATKALDNYTPAGTAHQEFGNITVTSGGALIPTSAVVEINTCSKMKDQSSRLGAKARECWLSQSAHFVVAKYTVSAQSKWKARNGGGFTDLRGTFDQDDIKFHSVADDVSDWAGEEWEVIQDFQDLLLDLVDRVRAAASAGKGETFVIEYGGEGMDFEISPSDAVCAVSEEVCERMKKGSEDGV